jgi:exosortase H (IPTLxxWG-CTERM-specific)
MSRRRSAGPAKDQTGAPEPPQRTAAGEGGESFFRRNRREITFLVVFVVLLAGSFTLVSVNWVNDRVIEPFTSWVAQVSGWILNVFGQHVALHGTVIKSERFAVNIRNGCNGVEAMLIFFSAVLAFPAGWRARLIGLGLGLAALQGINLIRVVALFLTGVYWPRLFEASHTVVWQSIVILCSVLLWILWASRLPVQRGSTS